MAHLRWLIALPLALAGATPARTQVILYPYSYFGSSFTYVRSYGYGYPRHRVRLGSSYTVGITGRVLYGPGAPYGPVSGRTIVIVPPAGGNGSPRSRMPDEYDTTGVDLDEVDPVTRKPHREVIQARPDQRERPVPPPKKPEPPPLLPPLPPPKPFPEEPREKDLSLVELGKKAFADREYGLAAQRFRLAVLAEPKVAINYFLLAQAQFALAKYQDAVGSIQSGMDRRQAWPRNRFPVRELYQGNEFDFLGHLKRLEEVVDNHPDDRFLAFLLAYELWFDGKRARALPLFEKARKLSRNPVYIDPFLRAAPPGPVAVK